MQDANLTAPLLSLLHSPASPAAGGGRQTPRRHRAGRRQLPPRSGLCSCTPPAACCSSGKRVAEDRCVQRLYERSEGRPRQRRRRRQRGVAPATLACFAPCCVCDGLGFATALLRASRRACVPSLLAVVGAQGSAGPCGQHGSFLVRPQGICGRKCLPSAPATIWVPPPRWPTGRRTLTGGDKPCQAAAAPLAALAAAASAWPRAGQPCRRHQLPPAPHGSSRSSPQPPLLPLHAAAPPCSSRSRSLSLASCRAAA